MDFSFVRILVIVGAVRVLMRGELSSFRFRLQDGLILAFVLTTMIATVVRTGGAGTINRLGFSLDVLGLYFLSRCLVRSQDDLVWVLRIVVFPMILVAIFFLIERATGRNAFYIFGGVSEITDMRERQAPMPGSIRASDHRRRLLCVLDPNVLRSLLVSLRVPENLSFGDLPEHRDHLHDVVKHACQRCFARDRRMVCFSFPP